MAATGNFVLKERRERGECDSRLLGLAMGERSGADHQRAIGHGIAECRRLPCVSEQFRRSDGRPRLAPVRLVGGNDGEPPEAEIRHRSRRRSYIEGVARGDKHYFDAVALGFGEQEMIVERPRIRLVHCNNRWLRRGPF